MTGRAPVNARVPSKLLTQKSAFASRTISRSSFESKTPPGVPPRGWLQRTARSDRFERRFLRDRTRAAAKPGGKLATGVGWLSEAVGAIKPNVDFCQAYAPAVCTVHSLRQVEAWSRQHPYPKPPAGATAAVSRGISRILQLALRSKMTWIPSQREVRHPGHFAGVEEVPGRVCGWRSVPQARPRLTQILQRTSGTRDWSDGLCGAVRLRLSACTALSHNDSGYRVRPGAFV